MITQRHDRQHVITPRRMRKQNANQNIGDVVFGDEKVAPPAGRRLSLLPLGVSAMNGFLANQAPAAQFDVSLLPNADEVVRHLFPNVTITTDDGTRLRAETRASVALPY